MVAVRSRHYMDGYEEAELIGHSMIGFRLQLRRHSLLWEACSVS